MCQIMFFGVGYIEVEVFRVQSMAQLTLQTLSEIESGDDVHCVNNRTKGEQ